MFLLLLLNAWIKPAMPSERTLESVRSAVDGGDGTAGVQPCRTLLALPAVLRGDVT